MCGRAAYSAASFSSAASALRCGDSSPQSVAAASSSSLDTSMKNPNMSPGTSAQIFLYSHTSKSVCSAPMIWGLVPNNGSTQSPHLLPSDDNFTPSPHYTMFNARSETVDTKVSFRNLLRDGQTCIFAVDGYYEWMKSLSPIDKKKQPYFVKSSSPDTPLLLAGLWTRVRTGRRNNNQEETISTFTILTTEAHPKLAWLHPRQPCILSDSSVAREWLQSPSKALVERISSLSNEQQQQQYDIKDQCADLWECYPVTKKMNDAKYHGDDCTVEVTKKGRLDSYFATSPSPRKRKKIDVKEDHFFKSTSQQDSEEKDVAAECFQKDEDNVLIKSNEWSCHVCTFLHTESKSQFLVCEMCGSERECTQDSA